LRAGLKNGGCVRARHFFYARSRAVFSVSAVIKSMNSSFWSLKLPAIATSAVCGLLVACSSLPRVPSEVASNAPPTLVGAHGELSPERSKAILKAVDQRSGGSELLKKHLSIEEEINDFPLGHVRGH
jgi:hypothetical protein